MPNPVVGLASALARTFLVIGLGALAASTGYIGRDAAAGIGPLVAKVSGLASDATAAGRACLTIHDTHVVI